MGRDKNVEVEVTLKRKFDKSLLVIQSHAGAKREVFIPLKCIQAESEINEDTALGESGLLVIPEWLAKDRDLVEEGEAVGEDGDVVDELDRLLRQED
jgi:hypothetical protein